MRAMLQRICTIVIALSLIVLACRSTLAADQPVVHLTYTAGDTQLDKMSEGVRLYSNRDFPLKNFPPELRGLTFTKRPWHLQADVAIDAPAGTTVYLLLGNGPGGAASRTAATDAGWTKIGDAHLVEQNPKTVLWVYKLVVKDAKKVTIPGGGWFNVAVLAKNLDANVADAPEGDKQDPKRPAKEPANPDRAAKDPTLRAEPAMTADPIAGPTTKPVLAQTTIKALEVYTQDSGMMLGQTSEVVLTLRRSDKPKLVTARFVTPVGDQMRMTRDESLRFIHLNYPNWDVDDAEITFEDKYVAHDGGSIGAAIGTMILSTIQGFLIDPDLAITGDISANGKVRAIGGVSAKIRGAIASKCAIVAIPAENEGQLVDAVTYFGPGMMSQVQIIGISTLDDAVATARVDRDMKLKQAIAIFASLQPAMQQKDYLKSKKAQDDLQAVLAFAPQHLSAKILLAVAQGKQPKTLSATASCYYTAVAVHPMLEILVERNGQGRQVPSGAVKSGLADLKKLRPLADPNVRPLIDAWANFIDAFSDMQSGAASGQRAESKRQALLDEMAKQKANADMMQKMLKEGI